MQCAEQPNRPRSLEDLVRKLKAEQESILAKLRNTREEYQNKIEECRKKIEEYQGQIEMVDALLADLGLPQGVSSGVPVKMSRIASREGEDVGACPGCGSAIDRMKLNCPNCWYDLTELCPPDLKHTRPLLATVGDREYRPDWNQLMRDLHVLARKHCDSWDAFRRVSRANIRRGKYEKGGYKYMQDGDFSIQGVDANRAWEYSLSVVRELKIPLKVQFEWLDKEDAAHPGETGIVGWTPTGS